MAPPLRKQQQQQPPQLPSSLQSLQQLLTFMMTTGQPSLAGPRCEKKKKKNSVSYFGKHDNSSPEQEIHSPKILFTS
ncbi:Hypothetical predicted protein [Prunus dulcis]|uniref:Uncharacterized protein n=1 Tax=Prunus dulcis TaxID=3755 RepID=A0A5E4G872_PRUDU|nr:Hypothetical predicted protein [Prunus dulcis]